LPQNQCEKMTSIYTPFTLQCKPINCTNDTSFVYKSPITQYFSLDWIYVFPEYGPFGLKHFEKKKSRILTLQHFVVFEGFFFYNFVVIITTV
jgi:hypothetical protein